MAMTNKQLAERARDLGRQMEQDVETSGLNKEQLTALVSGLEAELGIEGKGEESSEEAPPSEEQTSDDEPPTSSPEPSKSKRRTPRRKKASHYVAKGRAVQSPRGQLREQEDVLDTDFEPEVLELLVKKGCVKKRG